MCVSVCAREHTEHSVIEQAIVKGELLSGLVLLCGGDEAPVRGLLRRLAAVVGNVREGHLQGVQFRVQALECRVQGAGHHELVAVAALLRVSGESLGVRV